MTDPRTIKFKEFRCHECLGWTIGKPHAYVNGSGWCKWCVTQMEHPLGWMMPPRIDTPLGLVVWVPLIGILMLVSFAIALAFF